MSRLTRAALTSAVAGVVARSTPFLDRELAALPGLVGPGDVCIDVGAAAGVYSQALSHLVGPSGRVHSVEPLVFSHPLWSRVLASGTQANVQHHPVALGAEPGRTVLRIPSSRAGLATSLSFLDADTEGVGWTAVYPHHVDVLVDVDTLDRLCTRAGIARADFVKIDVEGAELHVLRGGERTLTALRPTLLIEIEQRHTERYGHTPDDVTRWLRERDYRMFAWRDGWHPVARVCPHANNYLFVPRGRGAEGPGQHVEGT